MSDYMFMLDNHLTPDQSRAVAQVESAAARGSVNLFLTGGAIRDMIGGFPIRDLDFTVEGDALKLAKAVAHQPGVELISTDTHRKRAELRFPGGVPVEIAMARQERFAKPGGKPQVIPAMIHEDLRGRDFTVNALALSLNRASRGLLIDPTNGLSDLEHRELRATGNYTMYDEPIRIFRLIRFRVRLGYTIAERTQSQYENAREAGVLEHVSARALQEEFRHIAAEQNPGDILEALEKENLLALVMPELAGPKLNLQGFAKLQKSKQLLPFGIDVHLDSSALFFHLLTEKLNPKERGAFVKALSMEKEDVDSWAKLETKSRKLEKDLQSPALQKHSALYKVLAKAPGELLIFLLIKSQQRTVVERIKNFYQKYLPLAQEVTDRDVAAAGVEPGTPKFAKLKEQMISAKLDARPKKVPAPVESTEPPPPPPPPAARRHA